MEIKIKTTGIHDPLATVEIVVDRKEAVELAERLSPSELDWAAVRAERDEARDRSVRHERQIEKLKAELAYRTQERDREAERANKLGQRNAELKAGLAEAGERVNNLNERNAEQAAELANQGGQADLRDELIGRQLSQAVERAEQNLKWAERAEARLEACTRELESAHQSVAARDRLLEPATRQLRNISRAVAADRPHIRAAQGTSWTNWNETEAASLTNAIRDIQQMSAPWADPPKAGTSQA